MDRVESAAIALGLVFKLIRMLILLYAISWNLRETGVVKKEGRERRGWTKKLRRIFPESKGRKRITF